MVIVDIDGVLADPSHRLHYIQNQPPDWDAFFDAMTSDPPNLDMMRLVRVLHQHYDVVLFTGRPESHRGATEDWLRTHGVPYDALYMRKTGDHRPDDQVKPEFIPMLSGGRVEFIIEDRPRVCRRWRELGFRVLQTEHKEF